MSDLKDSIAGLHELHNTRTTAMLLREQGLRSLRMVKKTSRELPVEWNDNNEVPKKFLEKWTCSGSKAEVALLVKIQNHYHLSENETINTTPAEKSLIDDLIGPSGVTIADLLPLLPSTIKEGQTKPASDFKEQVPVLVAARVLSALAMSPPTVFSKVSMLCYYRIVRELYYADYPDWTIGGARAGAGGRTSAFVTGECIRAIMALEAAVRRTGEHLRELIRFYDRHSQLSRMIDSIGDVGALSSWASHAFDRMWLDWYISTHRRNGAISFDTGKGLPTRMLENEAAMTSPAEREQRFATLMSSFASSVQRESIAIGKALQDIRSQREEEVKGSRDLGQRTASAHLKAENVLVKVKENTAIVLRILKEAQKLPLQLGLSRLHETFRSFPAEIHRVLDAAITYVDTVLDRELSLAHAGSPFDAGELVFAASAYGAVTKWQDSEKLRRACDHLITVLPETGRFVTHRAYHADKRGYKRFPAACEMTRSFAKLLHRSGYEFHPSVARKMIRVFLNDKQFFQSSHEEPNEKCVGWNFENAPEFDRPCVWVTAIAVQALDRIVRMLNSRINEEVFRHFKVVKPGSHEAGNLTLNDLVYPDHGTVSKKYSEESIALRLEKMRAHIMRVPHAGQSGSALGSAIFYGPPATGKTSLLTALASSARVPLVMLSPSDLIVQGQEQLEGRARVVFDALSMLTQSVILLDEFEPVLQDRKRRKEHQQDQAILRFLVTGMLPKLKTLHDAGRKQYLVYCLATNHLEQIDEAAKRPGRFDLLQPVYMPDPLSRAGTFLYALHKNPGQINLKSNAQEKRKRIGQIVAATAFINARDLADSFKIGVDGRNLYVDFLSRNAKADANEIDKLIIKAKERFELEEGKWKRFESTGDRRELEDEGHIPAELLQLERRVLDRVNDENFDLNQALVL
ncbi:MAG TPA: ATP-binding protein [Pyrinomonadaceae bacterium]|nr:ATP-binding protein [Pyrinomonadaceae bacterium]